MPQPPPPPKRGMGGEDMLPSEVFEQLNEEIALVTFIDEHLGHSVVLSSGYKLWSRENCSLHSWHMYS